MINICPSTGKMSGKIHCRLSAALHSCFFSLFKAVGLHRCGSIRLAETPTRMDEFRLQQSRASWYTAPTRLIDVDEVKELCPLINTDGLLGGFYNPFDGHIDPYSVTMAMGVGARMHGAKICTNTSVSLLHAGQVYMVMMSEVTHTHHEMTAIRPSCIALFTAERSSLSNVYLV